MTKKNKPEIHYKDLELLRAYLTEQGKILPRRKTNLTVNQQKKLKKAVKRARLLSFLPFIIRKKK